VFIELKAMPRGDPIDDPQDFSADIVGKTVGEIFAAKGFLKETQS